MGWNRFLPLHDTVLDQRGFGREMDGRLAVDWESVLFGPRRLGEVHIPKFIGLGGYRTRLGVK
jgi:hypothetical protein